MTRSMPLRGVYPERSEWAQGDKHLTALRPYRLTAQLTCFAT
jgi:hypothetical protein